MKNNNSSSERAPSKHIETGLNYDEKGVIELDTKSTTKNMIASKSSGAFGRFSKFISRKGGKIKQKSFSENSKKKLVNKSINRCLTWPDTSISLEKSFIADQ